MKVELIECTGNALELLLKTKNTRLGVDSDPATWSHEKRMEHLSYMKDTIASSWEFIHYTFQIEGVTRAFTHQFVRTRTGSYAQQTMRSLDVRDQEVVVPSVVQARPDLHAIWDEAVDHVMSVYSELIDAGVAPQDARGILPTNITTSILAKFNLRTLSEMAKTRLCVRTQGEYQDVFRAMREAVLAVHWWAEMFLQPHCVALGVCAFPRYGKTQCPVFVPGMDNEKVRVEVEQRFWDIRHEACPKAKEGKTQ